MFSFIKEKLQKIYNHVVAKLGAFFTKKTIDEAALKELELILLSSDVGVKTTQSLLAHVRSKSIQTGEDLYGVLRDCMIAELTQFSVARSNPSVIVMVGINGSGKTTSAAKLAWRYKSQGKKVLLVAADTFRAAAVDQLSEWAKRLAVDCFVGEGHKDPSAVVFGGCQRFLDEQYDILIIDTAGRLQTKQNLMQELAKMYRTIAKVLPNESKQVLLTVDAMLGQNSFDQARLFHASTPLDGIIMTKMDGTAKGGIVFAITAEIKVPLKYITFGESVDALKPFDASAYVTDLLSKVE